MVHAEDEIGLAVRRTFAVLAPGLAGGEFVSAKRVFRAKIARTDAVSAPENARRFFRLERGQRTAEFRDFIGLAQRDADVARERIVAGHAFVGAFENDDVLLAAQRVDDGGFGERTNDVDVNGTDLGVALVAQVIARGLDVVRGATERDENRVGIVAFVLRQQSVDNAPSIGQILRKRLQGISGSAR